MELYIEDELSDITYMSELIPTSMQKFSLKILAYLTSRDEFDNPYPSPKHPKNLFDIFGIGFGINSRIDLTCTVVFVSQALI